MSDYIKIIKTGKLIPKLDETEISDLISGGELTGGELIYNTENNKMQVYNGTEFIPVVATYNSEENRLISLRYDSTTEESDNIYEYSVITEIIAVVMSQNNGVYASAAVEVGIKDFSTDCLLASGQVDPYAASGTKYKFDVFFPIGEGISSVGFSPVNILVTNTSDPTSTDGNIVFLFKVSNFHIYT